MLSFPLIYLLGFQQFGRLLDQIQQLNRTHVCQGRVGGALLVLLDQAQRIPPRQPAVDLGQ